MIAMLTPGLFFFLLMGGFVALVIFLIKLLKKNPKLAVILIVLPFIYILTIFLGIMPLRVFHNGSNRYDETTTNTTVEPLITVPNSESTSPIWSEGIENEFEADVYPSGISALKALAPQVVKNISYVMGESDSPETIVIYSDSFGIEYIEEFRQALSKLVPEIKCRIEIGNINLKENELGIRFSLPNQFQKLNNRNVVKQNLTGINDTDTRGTIQAQIYSGERNLIAKVNYINKPWIEDFSSFANSQPGKNYIIAKSNETCMSPNEAEQQAMQNVLSNIIPMLSHYLNINNLQYNDIQRSGMIVDKFVQSFDTSTGKIWREAILLDVSHAKLTRLANIISNTNREKSMDWARTTLSIVGLFVLIVIVYAFLNAATKGYYSSSLKIIGIILAAAFLFIILKLI